ncbi:MAG: Zn-ribbon domain-containing OB-fold protein, partial [Acidimicrobiales bacterium]
MSDGAVNDDAVTTISTPIRVEYQYTAGLAQSRFLKGIAKGHFLGQRCPKCKKVYVPPRGSCPTDGVATTDEIELPNTGTVTTFCVVNVPFAGQKIELPYICAQVLLDGADIAFMG